MKTQVFQVNSLTCPMCARDLERSIGRLAGVTDVKISFTLGQMKVVFEESLIDVSSIQRAITKAGYTVKGAYAS